MSSQEFVTLMSFTNPHEVALIRGYLEAEGIPVFMRDELTIQVHNLWSNAVGGIKLQVACVDAERALAVLRDGGFLNGVQAEQPLFVDEQPVDDQDAGKDAQTAPGDEQSVYGRGYTPAASQTGRVDYCPVCGSDNVSPRRISAINIISLYLLLGIPIWFRRSRKCHCFECGTDFKAQKRGCKGSCCK